MKELNKTVWACVSIETVKGTDIWKKYQDKSGKIPRDKFSNVMKAALYEIGYDIDKGISYKKDSNVHIRSTNCGCISNQVLYKTTVYSFPVRENFKYKDKYNLVDMVHLNTTNTDKSKYIHIEDFGLEEYLKNTKKGCVDI